jgi:hypothetical protein
VSQIRGRIALIGLLSGLAACGDPSRILSPDAPASGAKATALASVNCTVVFGVNHSVSSFRCANTGDASASATDVTTQGMKARVLVGGQYVYITVGFGGFTWTASSNQFAMNVTVQNLMTQPMGTTDGVTAAAGGTKLFVVRGPSVYSGTGTITIPSDSGVGDFTGPNQPYWQYDGIIKTDSVSKSSNWKFDLPSQASGIEFAIEITSPIPAENSVLRWEVLRQGLSDSSYNAVWQQSSSNIYAVGNGSTVAQYNGSSWSLVSTGLSAVPLMGVYGFSASDVWVVGGATTAHYNGTAWTTATNPGGAFEDVWGTATNNVYAVGYANGKGDIAVNTGSGFSTVANLTTPRGDTLRAIWGADPLDIVAVGDGGTIIGYYQNGNVDSWSAMPSSCGTANFYGVWGTTLYNIYAVGTKGTICQINTNGDWAPVTGLPSGLTTTTFTAIGGSSASDIWVTGTAGVMLHYNGTTWSLVTPVIGTTLMGVTSGSATSVAIVGTNGTLLNYTGSQFALSPQAGVPIYGIWATDTNNIYASSIGTILHYNGSAWTNAYPGAIDTYNAISGASNSEIFTVGSLGDASIYSGSAWASVNFGSGAINDVWVINSTLAYGCGNAGALGYYNGTSYVTSTPASTTANLSAVWGDGASNVYTVATNGSISHFTGGSAFTSMTSGTTTQLNAIHGLTGVDVWAAGNAGTVDHSLAGSTTWTVANSGTNNNLHAVWDAGSGDVYAFGDAGTIQHYNGTEWLNMPSGVSTALRAVHGTSETHIIVGGDNGVVLLGTR